MNRRANVSDNSVGVMSENQFNKKATTEAFDEIYTSYDVSVKEDYIAQQGYPFDYPTRWLNDPSMNKRIAIRRLDVTPSTHSFTLILYAEPKEDGEGDDSKYATYSGKMKIDITYQDSLVKVLNFIYSTFSYDIGNKTCGLNYEYDVITNELTFTFVNSKDEFCKFRIGVINGEEEVDYTNANLFEFLKFLNQPITTKGIDEVMKLTTIKTFKEVWSRDRLHFHASFSTSRRKFIGKRGDFYQNLSLLYPSPTNESTFYIRFTSNGIKNILIRYCEFDIQLCYIANYKKVAIL